VSDTVIVSGQNILEIVIDVDTFVKVKDVEIIRSDCSNRQSE